MIVHESVVDELTTRIAHAYAGLSVGDPLVDGTLVGPLIDQRSYDRMAAALEQAVADGGEILSGGRRREVDGYPAATYAEPALVTMPAQTDIVRTETFAPILYVLTYADVAEAIKLHNGVPQGLSSAIFTRDQREAEQFMAADGSDCGIVNVNIGTSGAEIGGAFGGERAPAVAANPGRMPGGRTCAGRRTPSTTPLSYPWPRASPAPDRAPKSWTLCANVPESARSRRDVMRITSGRCAQGHRAPSGPGTTFRVAVPYRG